MRDDELLPELFFSFLCGNLIRAIDDKASLKVRRKTIAWDDDYLFAALTAAKP